MSVLPRSGPRPISLALSCWVLCALVSCASAPVPAKASASTSSVTAAQDKAQSEPVSPPPADIPLLSEMPRVVPPPVSVLVLGLPSPEPGPWLAKPDLGEILRSAPALPGASRASSLLGDPGLPPRLTTAQSAAPEHGLASPGEKPPGKAAAPAPQVKIPSASPEANRSSSAAPKPSPAKEGGSPKKTAPAAIAAPAAPAFSRAVPLPANPAVAETIPSISSSLVPLVDLGAPSLPPAIRSFQVEVGGQAFIPFVGAGWTYLGERDGKDGVQYDSRRFEGAGALFTLVGAKVGEYSLRFLRQDLVNGTSSEELVHLSVLPKGSLVASATTQAATQAPLPGGPAAGSPAALGGLQPAQAGAAAGQTQATASPASSSAGGPAVSASPNAGAIPSGLSPSTTATANIGQSPTQATQAQTAASLAPGAAGSNATPPGPAQAPAAQTAAAGTPLAPAPAPGTPAAFLATARAEYAAGRAPTTIAAAEAFLALSPIGDGADEALFLEAQALELNSPSRDVAKALGLYRRVVEGWPRSNFWSKANDRANYIQRYYFDIR